MNDLTSLRRSPLKPIFRMAVLAGVKASVHLHVRLGNDVNATDDRGRSALILAASKGHAEICRILLHAGADPTHQDDEGNDALAVAIAKGHLESADIVREALLAIRVCRVAAETAIGSSASPATEAPRLDALAPEEDVLSIVTSSIDLPIEAGVTAPAHGENPDRDELPRSMAVAVTTFSASPAPAVGFWAGRFPSDDGADFDLSLWEEETESPPPLSDLSCFVDAGHVQRRMSQHVPIDSDSDWDDVDLDLPDILVALQRRGKLDKDEEGALRSAMIIALRDGRIRGDRLIAAVPTDDANIDVPDAEFEANLRLTLGEFHIFIDDDPTDPELLGHSFDEEEEERYEADADEALGFLRALNSSRADPLALYMRDLPKRLLSREEETNWAMAIEDGMRDALVAVAKCSIAVAELSAALDAVAMGEMPFDAMVDYDDTEAISGAEETGDENETQLDDLTDETPVDTSSVPPELRVRIEAVRSLCHMMSSPGPGIRDGLAANLGQHLFAVDLSASFLERLWKVVEADPADGEARHLMRAGPLWCYAPSGRSEIFRFAQLPSITEEIRR